METKEKLEKMDSRDLKKFLKRMSKGDESIDYNSIKEKMGSYSSEEDKKKFLLKKIRSISKSSSSSSSSSSVKEKSPNPDISQLIVSKLKPIASSLEISNPGKLKKDDLVKPINSKSNVKKVLTTSSQPVIEIKKDDKNVDFLKKQKELEKKIEEESDEETKQTLKNKLIKRQKEYEEKTVELQKTNEERLLQQKYEEDKKKIERLIDEESDEETKETLKNKLRKKEKEYEEKRGKYISPDLLPKVSSPKVSSPKILSQTKLTIEKVKEILKKHGFITERLDDKKRSELLLKEYEKHKEKCDENNNYSCGGDRVCDVSTKPGICIDKEYAENVTNVDGHMLTGDKISIQEVKDRIKKVKEILVRNNIIVEQGVSEEEEKHIAENYKKYKETCDENNEYSCDGNRVCNLSTNPGVCVEMDDHFSKNINVLEYKGKKIIGTKNAIESLRKKLGIGKVVQKVEIKEPDTKERIKLINRAVRVTNKDPEELRKLSIEELENIIEQGIPSLIENQLNKIRDDELSKDNLKDIIERIKGKEKIIKKSLKHGNRDEQIELLSSLLNRERVKLDLLNEDDITSLLEALRSFGNFSNEDIEKDKIKRQLVRITGRDYSTFSNIKTLEKLKKGLENAMNIEKAEVKKYAKIPKSIREEKQAQSEESQSEESQSEESQSEESQSEESQSEEKSESEIEISAVRKKQESISSEDVNKVISEIISGKNEKITDITEAQNMVMKCLGLLS